jgi:hypothetical protein
MTTLSNREKNIMHEARQDAKVRPAQTAHNFEDLERVMRQWVTGSLTAPEEIYSPYYGA